MNTSYDGIINKPEIDDLIIEHYGIKGMKWKVRRARGKWLEKKGRIRRRISEIANGRYLKNMIRDKDGVYRTEPSRQNSGFLYVNRKTAEGYTHSRADFGDIGARLKAGIAAGRERVSGSGVYSDKKTRQGYPHSRVDSGNRETRLKAGIEAGRERVALDETKKARKRMNEARKTYKFKSG